MVIFRPKKRSGIAVRVGERIGTWQAKRPTTHKYRVKRKETGRGYFIPARRHNANGNISGTMKCVCRLSPGTHQDGTRASLAPNSAYYSFCFRFVRPLSRPAVLFPLRFPAFSLSALGFCVYLATSCPHILLRLGRTIFICSALGFCVYLQCD